jgi:hypothetical protein
MTEEVVTVQNRGRPPENETIDLKDRKIVDQLRKPRVPEHELEEATRTLPVSERTGGAVEEKGCRREIRLLTPVKLRVIEGGKEPRTEPPRRSDLVLINGCPSGPKGAA